VSVEKTLQDIREKEKLIVEAQRVNALLKEALQELIKDEEAAKIVLKETRESAI